MLRLMSATERGEEVFRVDGDAREDPHRVLLTPTTVVKIDARRKITCRQLNQAF